jgi:hypothetical protein
MEQMPYGKRLHAAARRDFRRFWSDYRWWLTIVGFFNLPIIVQVIHRKNTLIDWGLACIYALVSLSLSLLGSYAIAMRRGAEALDSQQSKMISDLAEQNSKLHDVAHPKVSPEEERKRKLVADKLKHFNQKSKRVMRYILDCGTVHEMGVYSECGAPEANDALGEGKLSSLLIFNHKMIEINPALKSALDFVLKSEGL